ncbi:DUF4345 domain-containing protein [Leptothoe kymatousa]|uniref:DUF4345 domain-containing protein n=1 Tax=Leptothoe kymatousa TAU-MAC 1615 TaxID=2364775 RepID=A0ABS5Y4A0_9CYAN|nr:DUF4345 domain-containing protein [Leptothoe kymatousa]MBT9312669.1 DUF4345 domain-containing protein [Leptothoe kymatousa TAU-MAC 1615]
MNLSKFVVYLAAIVFILYGLAFTINPNGMSMLVTGTELTNTSDLVDFRATYGGMTIAIGVIILYLHAINQIRPSLIAVTVVLLSMAGARTIGFIVDGAPNYLMYAYLVLELGGGLLALLALSKTQNID